MSDQATPAPATTTPPAEPYHGPDRRTVIDPPVKPGTAVAAALPAAAASGAAAGVAAARAAVEFGSMGLAGWTKVLGNATALTVLVVFMFLNRQDTLDAERSSQRAVEKNQDFLREEMRAQRDHDSQQREATRAEFRQSSTALFQAIAELKATREALDRLIKEMRLAHGRQSDQ